MFGSDPKVGLTSSAHSDVLERLQTDDLLALFPAHTPQLTHTPAHTRQPIPAQAAPAHTSQSMPAPTHTPQPTPPAT